MNKGAIILARYDSSRFPGKACYKIAGKKLLEWSIDAIFPNKDFEVVLATSTRECDDILCELAERKNIKYFRGDVNDVAYRTLECAKHYNFDIFARVNGDSPFVNKKLLKEGFNIIQSENFDFVTNLVPRSFPYGVAVEIFKTEVYESVYNKFQTNEEHEHVTQYFYKNIEKFNYYNISNERDFSNIQLVIDKPEHVGRIEPLLKLISKKEDIQINELIEYYNLQITK